MTSRGILTETPAILAYIAQTFPGAGLAPLDDPFAFAEVQSFNSYLCSTLHVAHAHRMRGHRWADDEASFADMRRKVPKSVGACYDMIESRMLRGPWVMGDRYSIADAYLFTVAQWLEGDGVDPARIPKVIEHRFRMAERPGVNKAVAEELRRLSSNQRPTLGRTSTMVRHHRSARSRPASSRPSRCRGSRCRRETR